MRAPVEMECAWHDYLKTGDALNEDERAYFRRIASGEADDAEFDDSLMRLVRFLRAHHGRPVVLIIDEYDAPVMAGYTYGYCQGVVSFLKAWLTGVLKDGGTALAFACLTGVQRISKESIFSDINNIKVTAPLSTDSDERYGFTDAEVVALSSYLGTELHLDETGEWYDGYRFGGLSVFNPWSAVSYLASGQAGGVPGQHRLERRGWGCRALCGRGHARAAPHAPWARRPHCVGSCAFTRVLFTCFVWVSGVGDSAALQRRPRLPRSSRRAPRGRCPARTATPR